MKALLLAMTFTACAVGTTAHAYDLILTSTNPARTADVDLVARSPFVKAERPVFSPEELRSLAAMGRTSLAASKRISIASKRQVVEIRNLIARRKLAVAVEPAEIPADGLRPYEDLPEGLKPRPLNTAGMNQFEPLQWAINNIGQKVAIALDDLTSYFVTGKKNEDIGIKRIPAESMDPKRMVKIAILDTGVDFGHPELADRLFENTEDCKALVAMTKCLNDAMKSAKSTDAKLACEKKFGQIDADGNGYPLDCSGWNVTKKPAAGSDIWGDADASDLVGHGTHIAGIIAARQDDGDGISGVLTNVRLLPVKVIANPPTEAFKLTSVEGAAPAPNEKSLKATASFGDVMARGLLYAIRSKAQIINVSLGWPANVDSELLKQMLDLAVSNGILVVAASGNDGTDALIRPCVYNGVICVASHDPDGAISHFSNRGFGVDIAAPGLNILSLFPTVLAPKVFTDRNGYELKSGTSMATPYVVAVLGRLLNQGYSAREAKARMMVGARKIAPNPRVRRDVEAFVQSGNLDLEGALAAKPQPLIVPVDKRPIELAWDRIGTNITFDLSLQNAWTAASKVDIDVKVVGRATGDARIAAPQAHLGVWGADERKTLRLSLSILSDRIESEVPLELSITATDQATGFTTTSTRFAALEIFATPNANDREAKTLPIAANADISALLQRAQMESVLSMDGNSQRDYIAFDEGEKSRRLVLLSQSGDQMVVRGEALIPAAVRDELLLTLQRVDLNDDGSSDYAVVWRIPPEKGKKMPKIRFRFFDAQFKPLALTYGGKTAVDADYEEETSSMSDLFRWVKVGKQRFPAWVARGSTPTLEQPKYDPWNPNPMDPPEFRFYYWGAKGLRTVNEKDQTPIGILYPTVHEMKRGEAKTLWVTGSGTDSAYSLSSVVGEKSTGLRTLDVGGFRRLSSKTVGPVLSVDRDGEGLLGSVFYNDGYRATQRATAIAADGNLLFDGVVKPLSITDMVNTVLAGFVGSSTSALMAQTVYDLQFHDLKSGEVASTSLRRFSFLPQFFYFNSFDTAVGESSNQRDRLPMVYLAEGFGTTPSIEIMAPRYEAGRLRGLVRPARLRLTPPEGCVSMTDTIPASAQEPTQVSFWCGNRFVFVPLRY